MMGMREMDRFLEQWQMGVKDLRQPAVHKNDFTARFLQGGPCTETQKSAPQVR